MARQRSFGGLLDKYLQFYFQKQAIELQDQLMRQRQIDDDERQRVTQRIARLQTDPASARRAAALGESVPPEFVPTDEEMLGPVGVDIGKATKIGDIPTRESIISRAQGLGVDTTPTIGAARLNPLTQAGDLPSFNLPVQSREPIENLMRQREAQRAALTSSNEYEDDRAIALEGGKIAEVERQKNRAANEFLPDVIRRGNETEAGLRPEKVATARGIAGAQSRGAWDVYTDPRLVQARLDYEQALEDIKVEGQRTLQTMQPTEGERRAAGQLQPLLDAHANLVRLGDAGVGLRGGIQTVIASPALANTVGKLHYSPEELTFGQSAIEWANIAGYIISGVQVRQDERGNFMAAMVENTEDPPQVKAQKRRAREAFLSAAQISAGRSAGVAGVAVGKAIKSGDMPANILNMFEPNAEFSAGVAAGLQ